MTQQLSKHRHISFTAHYTGYIWYQMGISHEALATAKGKSLAYLVHPIESWAEKYVGGSMRTTLKQRHTMLDHHLEQLIQESPDLQVLEIACGLSPRGWWFRQHYPSITYRELDLPDMAQTKQNALQQIEKNAPEILSVDLFTDAFAQAFEVFDPNRPLVVISEGLINYFDKGLLKHLIQSIGHYGATFKKFHYLTDLYPEPIKNKLASIIWNSSKLLKLMSRSSFSFHFKSPQEVKDFFKDIAFEQVTIEQPQIFFGQVSQDNHEEHLGDLVWIIHAQIK
ncbi:class I SAM-dependent methyltransferase [Acinetobacter pittii]|uniref:class I SAM-dependent methyltransferase n=1 Tax=Acinetobacter pittii TaxID=48296 RepID=UPI00070B87F5|nr:class I SAM-dependent methyltransferase [Acinetobacter pittii]KRI61815.1 leucine carboxyl methyltransferase [Acinetobacter pittii]RZG84776.1 leucine carboxyl methyltransferase [Acinetobacter pittii]RZH55921.1 leucine carboxyl methyltransferase [Acinetobacter pittii]RZH61412.1 leucine carboxyl methyltransferase [Acinetobacter pittii]